MLGSLPNGDMNTQPFEEKCKISIYAGAEAVDIVMQSIPELSDQKGAQYSDESAIGRSAPYKTYQNSENRSISWTSHFIVTKQSDIQKYIGYIRTVQAAVYPYDGANNNTGGAPYAPPPLCKIQCGSLLSKEPLNAVLKSYDIKYDTSVPWDEETFLPYKFDLSLTFDIIYNQSSLPNADLILQDQ